MKNYDVIVIGGSAAGLSAALVLARARRRVLVIDSGAPRNEPAAHMHGFLSRDGFPPSQLLTVGRREVRAYGGELADGTVTRVVADEAAGFTVELADGHAITARRVLVATGLRDELPDIGGLRDRWARDVLHCPYCHGWEVRDRRLGVFGSTPEAVRYAHIVRQWSQDVTYFTPPGALRDDERLQLAARGVEVVEGTVRRLVVAEDHLRGVEMDNGRFVPRDAIFVPPTVVPNLQLLADLDCHVDDAGWPVKDPTGLTSIPGLWVAGNVGNPRAQVITAAGEGSTAAIAINADLVDEDIRHSVALGHAESLV